MRTKISIFFIFVTLISFFSCDEEKGLFHPVPNVRVNLSLDILNTPNLQTIGIPVYISSSQGKILGYKGHGIYLIRVSNDEIKAFDASCTYVENGENHTEIKEYLVPLKGNIVLVHCTECSSEFNLYYGGVQGDSKAKYPLKEYRTTLTGNKVYVYNSSLK